MLFETIRRVQLIHKLILINEIKNLKVNIYSCHSVQFRYYCFNIVNENCNIKRFLNLKKNVCSKVFQFYSFWNVLQKLIKFWSKLDHCFLAHISLTTFFLKKYFLKSFSLRSKNRFRRHILFTICCQTKICRKFPNFPKKCLKEKKTWVATISIPPGVKGGESLAKFYVFCIEDTFLI